MATTVWAKATVTRDLPTPAAEKRIRSATPRIKKGTRRGMRATASKSDLPRKRSLTRPMAANVPRSVASTPATRATIALFRTAASSRVLSSIARYQSRLRPWSGKESAVPSLSENRNRTPSGM